MVLLTIDELRMFFNMLVHTSKYSINNLVFGEKIRINNN